MLLAVQQCTWIVVLSCYCCCCCGCYSRQIQCLIFSARIISILFYFSFVSRRFNTVLEAQLARASSVVSRQCETALVTMLPLREFSSKTSNAQLDLVYIVASAHGFSSFSLYVTFSQDIILCAHNSTTVVEFIFNDILIEKLG